MKPKKCFSKRKVYIILVTWQIFFMIFMIFGDTLSVTLWRRDEFKINVKTLLTITPELPMNPSLLIIINTIPSKFERREILRETWAKQTTFSIDASESNNMVTIGYFFTIGFDGNSSVDTPIEREADIHKDILRLNLNETYQGIVTKILHTFEWVANLSMKPHFIAKADDDVYIKVPDLARWLQENAPPPAKLYAGHVHKGTHSRVRRSPDSPWYVNRSQYEHDYFPDYCAGPFYVVSSNVLEGIVNASKGSKALAGVFPVEDAYIGVLLKQIGIKPKKMGRSLFNWNRRTNEFVLKGKRKFPSSIVLGDSLSSEAIQKLHLYAATN